MSEFSRCHYNRNINCLDPTQCHHCGWDPDVYEERLTKILHSIKASRTRQTVMLLHAKIPDELVLAELRAIWKDVRIT